MFNAMIEKVSSERACDLLNLLAIFTTFEIWAIIFKFLSLLKEINFYTVKWN